MSFNVRVLPAILLSVSVCLYVGCGGSSGPDRIAITGTASVNGVPIKSGTISLVPKADGPACGAEITDGKFSIGTDRGPTAGAHDVRITTQAAKSMVPGELPEPAQLFRETVDINADSIELKFDFTTDAESDPEEKE